MRKGKVNYLKEKWDRKYFYTGLTAFFVIAACILLAFIFMNGSAILGVLAKINSTLYPVYIGLAIAYLLNPLMKKLEKYVFKPLFTRIFNDHKKFAKNIARGVSIFLVIIFGIAIIIGLLMLVIPQLINSMTKLVGDMPSYYYNIQKWFNNLSSNHPELAKYGLNISQQGYDQLMKWLQTDFLPTGTKFIASVSGSVMNILGVLFDVLIGIIISIYLLANKEMFMAQSRRMLYSALKKKYADRFLDLLGETNVVFGEFISGKLLDSLIVGAITFLVLFLLNIPYAVLISVLIGVTNIIPFFGQYIGIIPSAFLVFLADPMKGWLFLIVIIVIMQVDGNVIGPIILGDSIGLGSFWILFSILVFGSLFGLLGMICAVPVFAILFRLVKRWSASRLRKKQLPVDTKHYWNGKPQVIPVEKVKESVPKKKEL